MATVSELIEFLQTLPQDLDVTVLEAIGYTTDFDVQEVPLKLNSDEQTFALTQDTLLLGYW